MSNREKKPLAVGWVLLIDFLLAGIGILIFAYFHHVAPKGNREPIIILPETTQSSKTELPTSTKTPDETMPPVSAEASETSENTTTPDVSVTPVISETPEETTTPEPDYSYLGLGAKFYDKFNLDGSVTKTDKSYVSSNIAVYMSDIRYKNSNVHVADIYVCDIRSFRSVLANDKYKSYESVESMGKRNNAVFAVNGDYYGLHADTFIVRNGAMYYDASNRIDLDVCVLYANGVMASYKAKEFDPVSAIKDGVWQAWAFGPKLLDGGDAISSGFNADKSITGTHPRTAIGYYEPGHYCVVCVDGRTDISAGLTMPQLSELMQYLGCTDAYNLDGGDTSAMFFGGVAANVRSGKGTRSCSDAIIVVDR